MESAPPEEWFPWRGPGVYGIGFPSGEGERRLVVVVAGSVEVAAGTVVTAGTVTVVTARSAVIAAGTTVAIVAAGTTVRTGSAFAFHVAFGFGLESAH